MLHALTIDVEEYFQVSGFENAIARSSWSTFESRVERSTIELLELLEEHAVKATFFVVGWTAERLPNLVRRIKKLGHELGSHSYWHQLIYRQSPSLFKQDLRFSCRILEDISGSPVRCYRAPSFSITKDSLWALDILAEEGILIDSSIFPSHHDRYGIPNANRHPHQVSIRNGKIWELPPTVARLGNIPLPAAGGGYFRLLPYTWTRTILRHVEQVDRFPIVFYLHPWEIDIHQPRIVHANWLSRRRHSINLNTTLPKLRRLLSDFTFGTLSEALNTYLAQNKYETSK